jgi:Phosphodiesterase/alkaline phosphatase D
MATQAGRIGSWRAGISTAWLLAALLLMLALSSAREGKADTVEAALPPPTTVIDRLAFGSCADQRLPQPIWGPILAFRPQLFLMLGDNVYGDVSSGAMTELIAAYQALAAQPGFASLRASVPILPIWDDHDYGVNDGGGDFPYRQAAAAQFRAFWRVPADSPRGSRDGLYDAATFGPPGERLQIILLDTRSFRSPLRPTDERGVAGKERYLPDPDPAKTMLGDEQWRWLAERLREPADLRLLVSSIQVVPDVHGWERWGNLPLERDRLFALIRETGAVGVVVLSGDRHFGAIYRREADVPYPLYEITSSSLNRPFRDAREADPQTEGDIFTAENFGTVEVDWTTRQVLLGLRDVAGEPVRSLRIGLDELAPH